MIWSLENRKIKHRKKLKINLNKKNKILKSHKNKKLNKKKIKKIKKIKGKLRTLNLKKKKQLVQVNFREIYFYFLINFKYNCYHL